MSRVGLSRECKDLAFIIENLTAGKETCEIGDTRYSLEDAIDYLRGFLQELKELDDQIAEHGNTPEMLEKVHEKYTELWLFQLNFTVDSLPRVIGSLWRYPDCDK